MKPTSAILFLFVMIPGGCNHDIPVDRAAGDYLGPGAVHVLSAPTKIEGWNFQRGDGTIASDPPMRSLDTSIARELGAILLDQATYRSPAGEGGFVHDVGFRVWRGDESVDVLLSFGNEQMQLKYRAGAGTSSSFASIAGGRDRLLRLAQRAYPDYKPAK